MGMKKILLVPALLFTTLIFAQSTEHKIVFDFTKADTASFTTMMRQLGNITRAAPNSKLEVVCFGPGLDILTKDKTSVQKQIEELSTKFNVVFAACEASMQRRGVSKDQLIPSATTVPLASLELSSKQQQGWSYIKAGN
jgi:intracellular sulfur oxidation DsrE/DsrF family protein